MLKKVFKDRRAILVMSVFALFSLVLLAGSIGEFTFHPARHLTREETQVVRLPLGSLIESIANIPLERQIAFFVMLFLFGILIMLLLTPEMRKRLLKQLLRLAMGAFLLFYLLKLKPDLLQEFLPVLDTAAGGRGAPSQVDAVPPPVFEPPQVSGWVSFLVTLGIVLLAIFLAWRISRWWDLFKRNAESPHALSEIARAARKSLGSLSSGGSAQDKIVQCYVDMSRVVDARRGLFREYAMTPAEFALRLEDAGLPREPVRRLTRLFEAVRYGARISTQDDVDEAIACLTSILKCCGEAV